MANEKAAKGAKNKKTTDEVIPGKEKSKDRRESSLPTKQTEAGKATPTSNRDEPKAEKRRRGKNENKTTGDEKPKKKNEEQKSKRKV